VDTEVALVVLRASTAFVFGIVVVALFMTMRLLKRTDRRDELRAWVMALGISGLLGTTLNIVTISLAGAA
jgi:uncharacterized membrane protein